MQQLSKELRESVMPLVMNNIITTRKADRELIAHCKEQVGSEQDFVIDELVKIIGTCCIGADKAPIGVKGSPDWKSVCLMLIDNIEAGTLRTKANKMLNDTIMGDKVDFDKLNLSKFGLDILDKMNEVVKEREVSPTVNVRCGWSVVDSDSEMVVETLNVDGAKVEEVNVDIGTGEVVK
jgi:hypothetical protein